MSSCLTKAEKKLAMENSEISNSAEKRTEVITLGGGCFWCIEAVFLRMKGVVKVESGYMGGKIKNPTYKEVCSGLTGHAEVVQVTYNPDIVTLADILKVFFTIHDPTQLNRQGNDVGTQYRSVVFHHNDAQRETTQAIISALAKSGAYAEPIVTEVSPAVQFYIAEDYHQNYYDQNKSQPYCRFVVAPKVEKFEKVFSDWKK
jgi:peptide-methionine (S)-S-oxide reductase